MRTVGKQLAGFIAATHGRSHEPDIIDSAKQCLLDWLGVALGAYSEPASLTIRKTVAALAASGRARIMLGQQTAPALAALANGTMGHCLDFDDTRAHAASHLSSPTWSSTLALGEHMGADETRVLEAFITGFEVAARIGGNRFDSACQFRGFHPTSVFGRFAAASAASVLLELDAQQVEHVLGAAATTCGGLNASFGTMSKPFHSGKAAMDGMLAAQLAADGFVAATDLFDSRGALVDTLIQDGSVHLDDIELTPGEALRENSFKPYACGKLIHPHIDAARALRDKLAGRGIRCIRCQVARIGGKLVAKPAPRTHLEAKFSIAYCLAMTFKGHRMLKDDFDEQYLNDPGVKRLMSAVVLEVNDKVPDFGAILDLELDDGEILHCDIPVSRGNPAWPLSWTELKEKYDSMAIPALGETRAQALHDAVRELERPGSLKRILAQLAMPARAGQSR